MSSKRVVLAADHAGFALKEYVKTYLLQKGFDVIDEGTHSTDPVDYPAIMRRACAVVLLESIPGIIFGGSGNGEAMAANKVRGIRAALGWSDDIARLARAHNDANVLSIGARFTELPLACSMIDLFLATSFEGGRHVVRVQDLDTPIPA